MNAEHKFTKELKINRCVHTVRISEGKDITKFGLLIVH